MRYLRCVYTVPAELHGLLLAALWEAGTLGIEDGNELVAWFAGDTAPRQAGSVELPVGVALQSSQWVAAADWLAPHRAAAQPLAVGERLWLDPREPDAPVVATPAGRLRLQVPARTAFGTGSHASTRLALRLLEALPLGGRSLLDVGAGSGVLAMAALALGARGAHGLDVDPAAALLAGQHARLNRLPAAFWAGSLAALAPGARFDVVVVNALPHEVLAETPAIAGALAAAGTLVVSGVPLVEEDPVLAAWGDHGLVPAARLAEEEWVAWSLVRR